ncbi:MurR/RpiR family transcriptional regulator [Achromobacter deleyi]|uniref:MurR/RpiR family transcriptional regulator n=1 Tax=Achromobacter deleyi TaxID=1353891 RepID=UPI0014909F62|nr:MurR/RpiR family transcriptional regulator [Achromobacter deleyi]QVQ29066.1 MurR/RpiR family transcriptional regulator [Achromobacter deleyi]UIP19185.1 MurR/RpiR family transcriptional regulator [Achromobacter deleyi]
MNLNQRIAGYGRKLSKTERLLVEEMQSRYPQGLLESATALAKKVGTSASTVVRLLAKLGYDSYAQAQMEARAEVTARLASPGARADAVSGDNPSARACLHNALLHDQHNLQETFASIDVAAFEAAVRLLTQRKGRVYVLGLRQAAPLASHVALYLNMCLPSVKPMAVAGPLFLEDQLLWVEEGDVLLVFTFRRYSVATANAVKYFRQRGGKVVLVTDSASAPAAASAHHVLIARSSSASPFDSYTAAFSLCNALLAAVAQRRKKELGAALARGESLWDAQWIRQAGDA